MLKRLNGGMTVMVWDMVACAMVPAVALAQLPSVGSMLPEPRSRD
ncbi:MAG TPA: hypothetical protein VN323_11375 [Candidatus Dormibacteraeota bacterium]|jgi:hypothetical protein|nr:hypothetical protein [Candidatus Dormibacteraeota bacterium]